MFLRAVWDKQSELIFRNMMELPERSECFRKLTGDLSKALLLLSVLNCISALHFPSLIHKTEARTACYHNLLQIVVKKEVLDCISLYLTQFQTLRRGSFQVFCMKERFGPHVIKVYL